MGVFQNNLLAGAGGQAAGSGAFYSYQIEQTFIKFINHNITGFFHVVIL